MAITGRLVPTLLLLLLPNHMKMALRPALYSRVTITKHLLQCLAKSLRRLSNALVEALCCPNSTLEAVAIDAICPTIL